jgi:hypothetical protein
MAFIGLDKEMMGSVHMSNTFMQSQEILMRIAQYSQPIREVQRVCNHPSQIIALQQHVTYMQGQ